MKRTFLFLVPLVGLITVACGATSSSTPVDEPTSSSTGGVDPGGMESEFDFGAPGDPSEVDRTIEITMLDTLRFDPETVQVATGETIRFEVTNPGQTPHEFVLGDEAFQMEHGADMGDMAMLPPDEANSIGLEPGTSKDLVWTFAEPGTVLYGCHMPGHYDGGMVSTVTVTEG